MKKSKNKVTRRALTLAAIIILAVAFSIIYGRYINNAVEKTTEISDNTYLAQSLLGFNGKKNILLLFMNNAESRYGGGFIGSVGYVTASGGKFEAKPVRGVYYYDWKFTDVNYREDAKGNQSGSGTLYNLRDGNSSLDSRSNGKRASIIFEKESGLSVDLAISITPDVLKHLLEKFGPIDIPEYNKKITKDNILETIQTEVEYGADKQSGRDPKTILSFVGSRIIEKIASMQTIEIISSFGDVGNLIDKRQLLIYSSDMRLAKILNYKKMDGALAKTTDDYLLLAENNYSVDKSNAFIDRIANKKLSLAEDGSATIELAISRLQTQQVSFEYIDPHYPDVVTNLVRANKSSIKLAVPKGSSIISTSENIGITKIDPEGGYDIYTFNSELTPLEKSDYRISYSLPFKYDLTSKKAVVNTTYQLQNGGWPYRLINTVQMPQGWKLSSSNVKKLDQKDNLVTYDNMVDRDQFLSFTYEKQ